MKLRMNAEQPNIDEFIECIMEKYHFEEKDKEDITGVYERLMECISPCAIYRINQWITGIKKIDENQSALVAITLGKGPDELQNEFVDENKLQEAYMVDCVANEILINLYDEFNKTYAKFHRRYVSGYIFIGEEIPLTKMRDLLGKLRGKDSEILDIKSNEFGVLTPSKSVVFYALLSDNPNYACEGICAGCNNANCDSRMNTPNTNRELNSQIKTDDEAKEPEAGLNVNLNYGYQRIFGSSEQLVETGE